MLNKLQTSIREFRALYLPQKFERCKVPVMIFAGVLAAAFFIAYVLAGLAPGLEAGDSLLKRTAQEGDLTRYEGRVSAGRAQVTVRGEFAAGQTVTVDVAVEGQWQSSAAVTLGGKEPDESMLPVTITWKSDTYTTRTYTGFVTGDGALYDARAEDGSEFMMPHIFSEWYGEGVLVYTDNSPYWSSPEDIDEFFLIRAASRAEVHRGVMTVFWMATLVLLPILALVVFAGEELARWKMSWYVRSEAEFSDWFYISEMLSWVCLLVGYAVICGMGLTQFI